jgi:hypothetical protein
MEQDLQHREIRKAYAEPVDVTLRVPAKGFVSFHQDEPEVYAAVVHVESLPTF